MLNSKVWLFSWQFEFGKTFPLLLSRTNNPAPLCKELGFIKPAAILRSLNCQLFLLQIYIYIYSLHLHYITLHYCWHLPNQLQYSVPSTVNFFCFTFHQRGPKMWWSHLLQRMDSSKSSLLHRNTQQMSIWSPDDVSIQLIILSGLSNTTN